MTEPVGFNSSLNYTPYDPDEQLCRNEGTGGASSSRSGGAEGAGGAPSAPSAPPIAKEDRDCTTEAMKVIASCGGTYLATKLTPAGLFGIVGCAATINDLVECLGEPETKAQGQ